MTEADNILNGPDRGYCPHFKANITKKHCETLQERAGLKTVYGLPAGIAAEKCPECMGRDLVMGNNDLMGLKQEAVSTKKCGRCNQDKPMGEYFRHPDGRPYSLCKECTRKSRDEGKEKRQAKKLRPAAVRVKEPKEYLMLDLSGYPQLMEKLEQAAGHDFRTVELQALYYLNKELNEDWRRLQPQELNRG